MAADAGGEFQLDPRLAYLNCASLGPSPIVVTDAIKAAMDRVERNPAAEGFGPMLREADRARELTAELMGCDTDEIAITRNTTEGMNLIATGLGLKRHDRVLTTDHEHAGGSIGWQHVARRQGIKIDQVKLPIGGDDADEIVRLFRRAIKKATRVISVSHVTYTTGLRLPVARLAELAHGSGCVLVVDGAQAVGGMDVVVRGLDCDAYATSGHKWLLGPKGTGLLYIRKPLQERMKAVTLEGGMGVYTASTGTRNLANMLGLAAALAWSARHGRKRMYAHIMGLRRRAETGLRDVRGLRIFSPPSDSALASGVLCVGLPNGVGRQAVHDRLADQYQIVVRVVDHAPGGLRIAPHVYNTEDDVDRLVAALRELV